LNKIFSIIKEEVDVLKNKPIDQMALKAHKMSFKSSFIRHTCEPSDLLFYYGHAFVMDRQIFNVKEFLRHIDNITAKQIQVVAKKYLTKENLSVSIIGNIQEKDIKV
jgi:predicted Zn-dependent peptidase